MRKPRTPRNALQDDLFLKNEGKVALLQHALLDDFQCIEPAVLQMLDEEDGALCSRPDKLIHSKVRCAKAEGLWRLMDPRGSRQLEVRDGELLWGKSWSFVRSAVDERRGSRHAPRVVLIGAEMLDLTSNLQSQQGI